MFKKSMTAVAILITITSMLTIGSADGKDVLPWGMTWDASIREYVSMLQTNTPGVEYQILEVSGGGEYFVDSEVETGEWRISHRALFTGMKTSNRITEHQLQDVESKNLKPEWVCISNTPTSGNAMEDLDNGNVMKTFLTLYGQFLELYGQGASEYSFVKTCAGNAERKYALPQRDGMPDFDAITAYQHEYFSNMRNLDHYWLVIGNGYASCRLYVTCGDDNGGIRRQLWLISYFFTKEPQENAYGAEVHP